MSVALSWGESAGARSWWLGGEQGSCCAWSVELAGEAGCVEAAVDRLGLWVPSRELGLAVLTSWSSPMML